MLLTLMKQEYVMAQSTLKTYYAQNYASIICQGLVTSIAVATEQVSP